MFPRIYLARQRLLRPKVKDVAETVYQELKILNLQNQLPSGATVGITAGSRGINNIVGILKVTVEFLKEHGYVPVIIAAMGSHGGGTAQGQIEVLNSLGITEDNTGAPIWSGTETVEVGETESGLKAYINKQVFNTDGVIVINRIKPHTALTGDIQSGLMKACVVGLGGPSGAKQFHSLGTKQLPRVLREIGSILVNNAPIIGGLAIVENGYEETAYIKAILAQNFQTEEPLMFKQATELMPRLPIDNLDILIVEQMGKNFSGAGIDTNVVGRFRVHGEPEPESPFIRRIVLFDLSEESHGNANGIGLADIVTEKLVQKIDFQATYLNCMTSTFVQRCFIPLSFPTEQKSVEMAIASLGRSDSVQIRIIMIVNTLHLEMFYVSEALLPEVNERTDLEIVGGPIELEFNSDGDMVQKLSAIKL